MLFETGDLLFLACANDIIITYISCLPYLIYFYLLTNDTKARYALTGIIKQYKNNTPVKDSTFVSVTSHPYIFDQRLV